MRRLVLPVFALACAAPLALASPAQEAADPRGVEVKLNETAVFRVLRAHGSRSVQDRARAARAALQQALKADRGDVRTVAQGSARVVFAGDAPVIELYPEDAQAAGDASLQVLSARVAARAREALRIERARSDVADVVFSVSLVLLFGLIALYVLRKIGEGAERLRAYALENPERISAIRVKELEVIGSGPLRGALLAALIVGRWVLQLGVVYVWLVLTFSRFAATRPYTERLTSFVATPLSELAGRLLAALPLGLLALVSAAVVYVVLRFVELFFVSVGRGETKLAWLPQDLVAPASLLIRVALVLLVLVFAGPIVTGDPEGGLSRAGANIMLALALATTPLLASVSVGVVLVFSRRVRVGQELRLGEHAGRVISVGLYDLLLRDDDGSEVRVPHLVSLFRAQRRIGGGRGAQVELCVAPSASLAASRELLSRCASERAEGARVELTHVDADGALFCVSLPPQAKTTEPELRMALAQALLDAGVPLGRDGRPRGSRP